MKVTKLIISLVFALVFTGVMSVSFLVEAYDAPDGVQAYSSVPVEYYGPPAPTYIALELDSVQEGLASWYGGSFHGRRTASGTVFNKEDLTAAHKSLPFGTLLRVVNEQTGKAVVVEVTDRGPFVKRRVVDLSQGAARRIGVTVTPVDLEALTPQSVHDFYVNNDSTVIVITADMNVQVCQVLTMVSIAPAASLSDALAEANEGVVAVVLPDGNGGTTFAVGKTHPAHLSASKL